jgi:addiction module RelE/StbE family toxin
MIKIAFSSSFKRAFKKRIKGQKEIESKYWKKVKFFIQDPFDRRLRLHKLSGILKELWSFSIEDDLRVILYFVDDKNVTFIDIGTHDEVY